jgi:hypothetical protein
MTYPDVQEEPTTEPSLSSYEAAFAAAFLAALTGWLASVSAAVLAGFVRFGIAPNIEALWSQLPSWTSAVDRLMPDLEAIARLGWNQGNADLGLSLPFTLSNQFIQQQLAQTRNFLVRIADEVYKDIGNALNKAVAEGRDVEGQAAAVRAVLDGTGSENWPARARTVAVTEVNRAYGFGVIAHGLTVQQQLKIPIIKMWDSKDDSRVRAAHEAADGQVRLISQPFIVGGEALMSPGDPSGSPSNVINCVPGSALILASGVQGAFRYFYEGKLIEVLLGSGNQLSMSPNHPILAERGWILAGQLQQGDNLISTFGSNDFGPLVIGPHVQAQPSLASDVFDALLKTGVSERVIGLPMNFHGDGSNSDVDVVLADRELRFGIDATKVEEFDQLCFAFANAPDASGGTLDQLLMASRHASDSIMSFADLLSANVRTHVTPFDEFCLTSPAQGNSLSEKSVSQGLAGNADLISQGLHGLSGLIALDKVVDIRDTYNVGHLYTFQTASGVYIADGCVSHNCRC